MGIVLKQAPRDISIKTFQIVGKLTCRGSSVNPGTQLIVTG